MGLILRNCAQIPPPDAFDDGKNKMTHYRPLPWAFFHQKFIQAFCLCFSLSFLFVSLREKYFPTDFSLMSDHR